jgi:hypothetical protein
MINFAGVINANSLMIDPERYVKRRVCEIRVEPYLAAYARRKFDTDPKTGGIRIPDSFDLYHCVWQLMSLRPRHSVDEGQLPANLRIHLPARRASETLSQKNPAYYNYIPPRFHWIIGKSLRRLFNWEFHHYVEQRIQEGVTKVEAVRSFVRMYHLGIDCEDALLKNMQRYERSMKIFLNIGRKKHKNTKK